MFWNIQEYSGGLYSGECVCCFRICVWLRMHRVSHKTYKMADIYNLREWKVLCFEKSNFNWICCSLLIAVVDVLLKSAFNCIKFLAFYSNITWTIIWSGMVWISRDMVWSKHKHPLYPFISIYRSFLVKIFTSTQKLYLKTTPQNSMRTYLFFLITT